MLKEDPDNPGNFTECDNGLGDPCINGNTFAAKMISNANDNWNKSYQSDIHLGDEPPESIAKQVQLVLRNEFFHRDDSAYDNFGSFSIGNTFGDKLDREINIFHFESLRTL